ncbi:hypothetical protein MNBD_CHLOROFLEXI01-5301 [hydrothermal vent metagenome]|uniref:Uncharacterized protein n=1 Tax=hydrothermal vent metagenome TaxID=652676 RepID=A0A3B0V1K0_9ZZZZ
MILYQEQSFPQTSPNPTCGNDHLGRDIRNGRYAPGIAFGTGRRGITFAHREPLFRVVSPNAQPTHAKRAANITPGHLLGETSATAVTR